jgi:hypothetical protein
MNSKSKLYPQWEEWMDTNFEVWTDEQKKIYALYLLGILKGFEDSYDKMDISKEHVLIHEWLIQQAEKMKELDKLNQQLQRARQMLMKIKMEIEEEYTEESAKKGNMPTLLDFIYRYVERGLKEDKE